VKITVKLGAPLSQVVGESKAILTMPEGATLADVLDELRARYSDLEAGPFEQAENTLLHDGDRVYLFLPVAGG
jgi:molybdopterin converting factor small subunit